MPTGAENSKDEWARGMVQGLAPMDREDVEDLECIQELITGKSPLTEELRSESA